MAEYDNIVRERQKAIRREIDRRKLSIKAIYMNGEWENDSTVLSYFPADANAKPALMSVAQLHRFLDTKALEAELLSLLLPDEFIILRKPEGINHDEIAKLIHDYLAEKMAAHHPDSECGPAIGPGEHSRLTAKLAVITSEAA